MISQIKTCFGCSYYNKRPKPYINVRKVEEVSKTKKEDELKREEKEFNFDDYYITELNSEKNNKKRKR